MLNIFKKLKKKEKKAVNQLRINFPESIEKRKFKVFNYYLPTGNRKLKHLCFESFDTVEFIAQFQEFYLMKMQVQGITLVAYCILND